MSPPHAYKDGNNTLEHPISSEFKDVYSNAGNNKTL